MQRIQRLMGTLVSLGPADHDHWAALRVGLSVAAPTLLLLMLGRPELTVYGVFGAFTAMYGRRESHSSRFRHQLRAATMLVAGVAIGVTLSVKDVHSWWLVAVIAIAAAVGSVFADASGLKPVGP